jgi:hypothetical protein
MLKMAYDKAAIYFLFTDVLVADPYGDIASDLKLAFVIGRSNIVGGVATDMIAVANDQAQVQIWIGVDDKLPRMMRATFFNEPGNFRHSVEFSNWQIDPPVPEGSFTSAAALKADRIKFASPDEKPAQ